MIQQHAKGEKHRKLSQARFSQTQRHFVLSATCGESLGKDKVPVPIQDMSQQGKGTTAEALWAMKTSSSDLLVKELTFSSRRLWPCVIRSWT